MIRRTSPPKDPDRISYLTDKFVCAERRVWEMIDGVSEKAQQYQLTRQDRQNIAWAVQKMNIACREFALDRGCEITDPQYYHQVERVLDTEKTFYDYLRTHDFLESEEFPDLLTMREIVHRRAWDHRLQIFYAGGFRSKYDSKLLILENAKTLASFIRLKDATR